jgi:hypothetical protein
VAAEGEETGVRCDEAEEAGDARTGCREKEAEERGFVGDVGSGTEAAIEVDISEAGVGVERDECGECAMEVRVQARSIAYK